MTKNFNNGNTALHDLLSSYKPKTRKRAKTYIEPLPTDPNDLLEDGEDHINISPYSKNELGKALSNETPILVNHSIFGKFRSVTGFWYYIKSKERDDRCRKLVGRNLKDFSKGLTLAQVKNFRAVIMDTVWQKIKQNPAIWKCMKESTLPFECYFENKSTMLRQRLNYSMWFIDGLNEIRKALVAEKEPDFSKFLDVESSDIYAFVIPERLKAASTEATKESISNELKELLRKQLETSVSEVAPETVFGNTSEDTTDKAEEVEVSNASVDTAGTIDIIYNDISTVDGEVTTNATDEKSVNVETIDTTSTVVYGVVETSVDHTDPVNEEAVELNVIDGTTGYITK